MNLPQGEYITMAREFAGSFYKRKEWVKTREYIMNKYNWICQSCDAPAKVVHHIVWLTPENIHDSAIAYGEENLIPLCVDCHAEVHNVQSNKKLTEDNLIFDNQGNLKMK